MLVIGFKSFVVHQKYRMCKSRFDYAFIYFISKKLINLNGLDLKEQSERMTVRRLEAVMWLSFAIVVVP